MDDLSAHGTKITNKLSTHLLEINSSFTAELGRINTKLNAKLTTEIKKINSRDAGYASKAQKIFNDMATIINSILSQSTLLSKWINSIAEEISQSKPTNKVCQTTLKHQMITCKLIWWLAPNNIQGY